MPSAFVVLEASVRGLFIARSKAWTSLSRASFACSASSATLLAATVQTLVLLSRIIKSITLEAAPAKHSRCVFGWRQTQLSQLGWHRRSGHRGRPWSVCKSPASTEVSKVVRVFVIRTGPACCWPQLPYSWHENHLSPTRYPSLFLLDAASGYKTVTTGRASIARNTVTISTSMSLTSIPHCGTWLQLYFYTESLFLDKRGWGQSDRTKNVS